MTPVSRSGCTLRPTVEVETLAELGRT